MPRKLLLQMHVSMDGYIADPDNSLMDWITFRFSEDLNHHIETITASVDCLVLGRKLAEGFIPAWASRPDREPGVAKMNKTPKTVLSATINGNPWGQGVRVVKEAFEVELRRMKAEEGGDIMAYGGVQTAQFLVGNGLVDEVYLLMSPVALGGGARLFTKRSRWAVIGIDKFECGVVVMHYKLEAL